MRARRLRFTAPAVARGSRAGDSAGVIQQLRRILPEFEPPPGEDVAAAVVAAPGLSSRAERPLPERAIGGLLPGATIGVVHR